MHYPNAGLQEWEGATVAFPVSALKAEEYDRKQIGGQVLHYLDLRACILSVLHAHRCTQAIHGNESDPLGSTAKPLPRS